MNKDYPKLAFPAYKFRVKTLPGGMRIWDEQRGAWLVLTPEEWVRRHLMRFLCEYPGLDTTRIRQECPVKLHGMSQRADVVIYSASARPVMLVECKAPTVVLDASVYAQAVRYNTVIGATYIMITNGLRHYIYRHDGDGHYTKIDHFPDLG